MEREPGRTQALPYENLQRHRGWFTFLGMVMIGLGILAIALPFAATFAIERLVGWLFLAGGVVTMVYAFRALIWGRFTFNFLSGIIYFAFGLVLLAYPLTGVLTLTLLLAVFFLVHGLVRIFQAAGLKPTANWGWVLFSGVVSLFLGFLIWAGMPSTAIWAIGVLVGIDLIVSGTAAIMLSYGASLPEEGNVRECVGDRCLNP